MTISNFSDGQLALNLSRNIVGYVSESLENRTHDISRYLSNSHAYDQSKLVKCKKTIPTCKEQWFIHVALLKEMSKQASTEEQRQLLRFLANNYLNKSAPIMSGIARIVCNDLSYQVGGWDTWNYYRTSIVQIMKLCKPLNQTFYLGNDSPFIPTDTRQIMHLFKLRFKMTPSLRSPLFVKRLVRELTPHIAQCKAENRPLSDLPMPFLLDLTAVLKTERNLSKIRKRVHTQISTVVDKLMQAKTIPPNIKEALAVEAFIIKNLTCICTIKRNEICGIKLLPIYSALSPDDVSKKCSKFIQLIVETGLLINPLHLRRHVLDAFASHPDVHCAIPGTQKLINEPLFPKRSDFNHSAFFMRACQIMDSTTVHSKPHIAVLGGATLALLEGLMREISPDDWKRIHKDPVEGPLVQLSLFKIQQHFSKALLHIDDFNTFSQEIEIVHAEFVTLLEIFAPFEEDEFLTIYQKFICKCIPFALHDSVRAGLGKTSVNVFAGINSVLLNQKPDAVRVYCQHFYYEQQGLISETNEIHAFLKDSTRRVDMYVGQFSPNIAIDPATTHYKKTDVVRDIQLLLHRGRAAKHLTVAIDCTIDQLYSSNIYSLLSFFKYEIEKGRLNFIFFQSGAKLNGFGMDNYFGAPFFIVNNGEVQWQPYNFLFESPAHRTDSLSHQWFSLIYKYATIYLSNYRKLIFNNTRSILQQVALFQPQKPSDTRIAKIDFAMDACFIDIKIFGAHRKALSLSKMGKFYYFMQQRHVIPYSRASFGFIHPNYITFMGTEEEVAMTSRLNPGINPEENQPIVDFLALITDSTSPVRTI
jgi:hypothetical protein